ncbi:hypothetical protein G647_01120 [Cladophialophora carrionii CBS 160.54]|uniref:RING-type E3 ubiquitin transferase n=1 Tax=Cladophialophora carrionii CBS 160.54 TaxID=1279043 RepID=V9DP39_9EURO|nr:uncharacterized protein G647_01120 [Cladophialophora carrionii CBS 160.54]ETI28669.1 hypothetical protein G647_01120 [Cladophialophora carrionii CBS 160.54]
MRPFRFLLLLIFFVALPIALTCWSFLAAGDESPADSFNAGYNTRPSRLRALFSFSTPSSLFPPSAVISLTNDNSTFFLARPAAFGPSLPSRGLSGQLWVGKGFGDDALLKEENLHVAGWELGCSDVPGWAEERAQSIKHVTALEHDERKTKLRRSLDNVGTEHDSAAMDGSFIEDDGTDDYLHHPLPDSNPAPSGQPGEPAKAESDKNKTPTHADIESLQESAAIAGKIVMLSRGGCGFLEKVKWAQRRGGIALIVGDNEKGAQLTIMYAKGDTSNVTIPALFTSYTSAHLLSSLVPAEEKDDEETNTPSSGKTSNQNQDANKPVFTSTKPASERATTVPGDKDDADNSWVGNVLSAMGLNDNSPFSQHEDSRRPPSSGNVEWVLVEDWKEEARPDPLEEANTLPILPTSSAPAPRPKTTSAKRPGEDDFVIGVQDWRDADLVAPKPATTSSSNAGKAGKDIVHDSLSLVKTSSSPEATLKGGSITPGSGEYDHEKSEPPNRFNRGKAPSNQRYGHDTDRQSRERASWLDVFRSGDSPRASNGGSLAEQSSHGEKVQSAKSASPEDDNERAGLWVTLTPTSVSTSPFFDTLLVLVVSPLMTLTVVYALLLLRSRIRRRRWRAPKSVVDRLPVRTYHTMTTASTTSAQASPEHASPTSPLLISTSQNVSQRPRPRSQTTAGSFAGGTSAESQFLQSRSPQNEKLTTSPKPAKRKRYTGRQVECVVCLEEYVDGESQVMSLPCGHEFHAECITPWLVTRRRTCPICKGDVVRSMARQRAPHVAEGDDSEDSGAENGVRLDESTSDDVQNRVAQTINEEPSAAIPIPTVGREDEDIERGQDPDVPLGGLTRPRHGRDGEGQSTWRNIVSGSVNRLSGDTLWRQTPVDRNR